MRHRNEIPGLVILSNVARRYAHRFSLLLKNVWTTQYINNICCHRPHILTRTTYDQSLSTQPIISSTGGKFILWLLNDAFPNVGSIWRKRKLKKKALNTLITKPLCWLRLIHGPLVAHGTHQTSSQSPLTLTFWRRNYFFFNFSTLCK